VCVHPNILTEDRAARSVTAPSATTASSKEMTFPTNLGSCGRSAAWRHGEDLNSVLSCVEHQFEITENDMATASGSTRTSPVPGRQRATTRTSVARQIKDQRRGYARAVLQALARTQHGRPTTQVQRVLRESLTPLGVRLSTARLHQLATDIAAGRPVELT